MIREGVLFVKRLPNVLIGSGLYFASTALISVTRFFLIPIYARYLSPEQYGILGTVNSVSGILAIIMACGLDASFVRAYYDYPDDKDALRRYMSTVSVFLAIFDSLIVLFLFVIGANVVEHLFPDKGLFYPFIAIGIGIAVANTFLGVFTALLRARQRFIIYAISQIGRFVILIGMTLALIIGLGLGAEGALLADLAATTLTCFVLAGLQFAAFYKGFVDDCKALPVAATEFFLSSLKRIRPQLVELGKALAKILDPYKLRGALAYGIPLVPYQLALWLIAGSDRLILAKYRGMDEVGIYTLGYSLAAVVNMVVSAIDFAYVPYFFQIAKNQPKAQVVFARNAQYYVIGMGGICLITMLFAKEVLEIVAAPAYLSALPVTVVVILAFLFSGLYTIMVLPLLYLKRTRQMTIIALVAAGVNVGLNFIIIPIAGAIGAAWTTVISYVIMFLLTYIMANRVYPIRYRILRLSCAIIFVALSGLILYSQPVGIKALAIVIYAIFSAMLLYTGRRNQDNSGGATE